MNTSSSFHDSSYRTRHFMHRARSNITSGPSQVVFVNNLAAAPDAPLMTSTPVFSSTLVSSVSSSPGISSSSSSVSAGTPSTSTNSISLTHTSSASLSFSAVSHTLSSPSPSLVYVSTVTSSSTFAGFLPVSVAPVINSPSTISQPSATAGSTISATSITHSPAFYIGILLGTVVVIASIATVVAWWIRVRQRKSRRLKDLQVRVPWARSSTVSSGYFETIHPAEGHPSNNDLEKGKIEDVMALRRGESEKLKLHLELMGDRDVGMPKRTQSYIEDSTSPIKRSKFPILSVPSPPPAPSLRSADVNSKPLSPNDPLPESVAYPLPVVSKRRFLPPLPSPSCQPGSASTADYSHHSRSHSFTAPYCPHPEFRMQPQSAYQQQFPIEFGTPREVVVEPRYLNVLNRERRLDSVVEESEGPSHHLSSSHSTGVEILRSEVEPAVVPSETWTASIRNRMMNALGFSSDESHASERYTDLPFPTPARARRASMRKAGWVQYNDGEIVGDSLEHERPASGLLNPFDGESVGLGIDIPQPSPSSNLPSSHPCIPRNTSQPYFYPTSACSLGSLPSDYAASVHSYSSAAPLVNKRNNLSVKSGTSRPVSRASSRYSAISRTGSAMTILTEKEEAAGRALRERWIRGETRRPKRV